MPLEVVDDLPRKEFVQSNDRGIKCGKISIVSFQPTLNKRICHNGDRKQHNGL